MKFSFLQRPEIKTRLTSTHYDLLIIGGGITGAGIALDAASRGLKTALLEKSDFAFGTSSRSTKLIHGGLRYLKQLEFGLVKEVGSERAILHKLAPHLVIAEKMLLPLRDKRGFGSILTSLGLKLYDWLAGVEEADQRKMLTRNQTINAEPLLDPKDVKGGGLYAEYRTDDARLTIEIIKKAVEQGCDILNYVQVKDFQIQNKKIAGAVAHDFFTNDDFEVKAKVVVNATGPWVDDLRELDGSKKGKTLRLTKGVHIVVERSKFPVQQSIYFDIPDGRMIFAIPRNDITYIGTTDTNYNDDKDEVHATTEDVVYLINGVNESFPDVNLQMEDIQSSWAGLRPLIHEEGKSPSELSRKDEIFESQSGLLSIAGGKLTGYRKMAERIVDLVIEKHFKALTLQECNTKNLKLVGADFDEPIEVRGYLEEITVRLKHHNLEKYARYLVYNYGKNTTVILDHLEQTFPAFNSESLAKAEAWYCIHFEMALTLVDFFIRRTGMLFFDINRTKMLVEPISLTFKGHYKWDELHYEKEREQLQNAIRSATQFKAINNR